jgi:serine-type D-Ala-D-Ala carboxypeptidase/endopeptidase
VKLARALVLAIVLPLSEAALSMSFAASEPPMMPTPTPVPAMPPVPVDNLKSVLDHEMVPVLDHGVLSSKSGGGFVIGVLDHGQRRIFAYGAAKPDSIFEIASIGKTFTGLVLAQMVVQKKVTLDEPVRALLPPGFVEKPDGPDITLLDLATHHSGLPAFPDNLKPKHSSNPFADYSVAQLQDFLARHGLARPVHPEFSYSNIGAGLLGYALSLRASAPFKQLVATEVTGPLNLTDTVIELSPEQRGRLIQGHNADFEPMPPMDFGLFPGVGALKSTGADMLTYLDANMHPERYAAGAQARTPTATFPAAVTVDHQPRADWTASQKIALFWRIDPDGYLRHTGSDNGYTAYIAFSLQRDFGLVVLYNRYDGDASPPFFARVAENIHELISGKPAVPLDVLSDAERLALAMKDSTATEPK